MATHSSFLKESGVDGTTIKVNPNRTISARGFMEPFNSPAGESTWYVDGNVRTTGDGHTWDTAFKTLVEGLAIAHAYQRTSANRAWAHRSTIYVCDDESTADMTALAEKTDVIGVGSYDSWKKPRISGAHVIAARTSSTDYMGCRFFNCYFLDPTSSGILFDIPVNQTGIEFHNCILRRQAHTIGIRATGAYGLRIIGCEFKPTTSGVGFSTTAIQINTPFHTLEIAHNKIYGAIGIDCNSGSCRDSWVTDNFLKVVGMAIDDESDDLNVINNRWISAAAAGSSHDINVANAVGNIATGNDHTDTVPLATVT